MVCEVDRNDPRSTGDVEAEKHALYKEFLSATNRKVLPCIWILSIMHGTQIVKGVRCVPWYQFSADGPAESSQGSALLYRK